MTLIIGVAILATGFAMVIGSGVSYVITKRDGHDYIYIPGLLAIVLGVLWLVCVFNYTPTVPCPDGQRLIDIPQIGTSSSAHVCATTEQALRAIGK